MTGEQAALRWDRLAGAVIGLLGLAIGLEGRTFVVGFLTDPLGPKALPLLVAGIMMGAGAWIVWRPAAGRSWPDAGGWRRVLLATASFAVYSLALSPLGFVLATTLEITALSRLFGGPLLRSGLAALAFSCALYALFVWGLRLPLPLGFFAIGGG